MKKKINYILVKCPQCGHIWKHSGKGIHNINHYVECSHTYNNKKCRKRFRISNSIVMNGTEFLKIFEQIKRYKLYKKNKITTTETHIYILTYLILKDNISCLKEVLETLIIIFDKPLQSVDLYIKGYIQYLKKETKIIECKHCGAKYSSTFFICPTCNKKNIIKK